MSEPSQSIAELMDDETTAGWLVTYADLLTLLLTFFVLLFSISSMDLQKYKEAISAIQVSLGEKIPPVSLHQLLEVTPEGGLPVSILTQAGDGETRPKGPAFALEDFIGLRSRDLFRDVQRFVQDNRLGQHINVSMEGSKVIIRVTGRALFGSGSSSLNPEATPILDDIAGIAQRHPEIKVRIEGHSDNLPITTPRFPSNWELSAVRATTVLRYMIDQGIDPHRLTATGYGSLLPLAPNTSMANRARNRRVEFVLEKEAG